MAPEEKKVLTYLHKQKIQLADELLLMISTIITYLELVYVPQPPSIKNPPWYADRGKELSAARKVWELGNVIASAEDLGLGKGDAEWNTCRFNFLQLLESYHSLPSRVMKPWSRFRGDKMIDINQRAVTLARRLERLISEAQEKFRNPEEKVTAAPFMKRPNVADAHYAKRYRLLRDLLLNNHNHDPYNVHYGWPTYWRKPPDIDDALFGKMRVPTHMARVRNIREYYNAMSLLNVKR